MGEPVNAGKPDVGELSEEMRLCFCTAAACAAVGGSGFIVDLVFGIHNSLPALLVIAALYALIGGVTAFKAFSASRGLLHNDERDLNHLNDSAPESIRRTY